MDTLLAITAHPDDAEIFCGGTIIKYSNVGRAIILVESEDETRIIEAQKSAKLLGAELHCHPKLNSELCERYIKQYEANIVVTHYNDDFHNDHRRILDVVLEAVKNMYIQLKLPSRLYSFDTYYSVGVSSYFCPTDIIDISDEIERKIEAFACHESQPVEYFKNMILAMGQIWGLRSNCRYGEAFKNIPILGIYPKSEYL